LRWPAADPWGVRAPRATSRAYQRATDRPYWIPYYGMYAGFSPDDVFYTRR
jgi:hypothetical protein